MTKVSCLVEEKFVNPLFEVFDGGDLILSSYRDIERPKAEMRIFLEEAAQAEAAKAVQRIKLLLSAFRGAEIDYYKNAVDAERPDKVNAEALFICLMPGGGSGCDLYEIRTKAGESMEAVRLTESGKPEPIGKEAFAEKLKASPSLILRDRGIEMISRPDLKVYFLDPTRGKRGFAGFDDRLSAVKGHIGMQMQIPQRLHVSFPP